MKSVTILLLLCAAMALQAQNCKPDVNIKDKITGSQNIAWQATIYESNFGTRLTSSSNYYVALQLGRYGSSDLLSIIITKYEESLQNAVFETQYRAEEGKPFYFAFSAGEPLAFTAQAVQTTTQWNSILKKLVSTVVISTVVQQRDIETLRKTFGSATLVAFRIFFAGNVVLEGDVKDKKAVKIGEKVPCFGDFYDKNPL